MRKFFKGNISTLIVEITGQEFQTIKYFLRRFYNSAKKNFQFLDNFFFLKLEKFDQKFIKIENLYEKILF